MQILAEFGFRTRRTVHVRYEFFLGFDPRVEAISTGFLSAAFLNMLVTPSSIARSFLFGSAGRGEEFRTKPANHRPLDLTVGSFLSYSETTRNYFVRDFSRT